MGYCLVCFLHLFPDQPVTRNYKPKERAVAALLQETFPAQTWIHDRRVADGCSYRRPDLLCDMGSHVVVVEIDEDQHSTYDTTCENKRLMEISRDIGHRPLVLIRFNPDAYTDSSDVTIPGCWRVNGFGACTIVNDSEWALRTATLMATVKEWLDTPTDRTVTVLSLYFNAH